MIVSPRSRTLWRAARRRPRVSDREAFLTRTYLHLLGAVVALVLVELALWQTGAAARLARAMGSVNWLYILGAFMIVAWLASRLAHRAHARPAQYAALGLYVAAKAVILVPLLSRAERAAPGALINAAALTVGGFLALTWVVFSTRRDFSFLGGLLRWAFVVTLLTIVGALVFGVHLGMWFSVLMVALAGAAVLNDTSKVLYRYGEDRYVAGALELFSSIALMFWYLLRILMSRD